MKQKFINLIITLIFLCSTAVYAQESYADVPVKVYQYVNGAEDVIYTGTLGGYDNGKWSGIDVTEMNMLTIVKWSGNGFDENFNPIYIQALSRFDITEDEVGNFTSQNISNNNTENDEMNSCNELVIRNAEIKRGDGTKVNSLKNNAAITSISIVNTSGRNILAVMYAVLYENGMLKNVMPVEITNTADSDSITNYSMNIPLNEITENSSLKLMMWDKETLRPYSVPLNIRPEYSIQVSAVMNQMYTLPIMARTSNKKFKVKYDNTYFEIDDLCVGASNKITAPGVATDLIEINSVSDGEIIFTFNGERTEEWINYISLKALKTGESIISVYNLEE